MSSEHPEFVSPLRVPLLHGLLLGLDYSQRLFAGTMFAIRARDGGWHRQAAPGENSHLCVVLSESTARSDKSELR